MLISFTGKSTSIVIIGELSGDHLKFYHKFFVSLTHECLTCSFHLRVISFGTSGLCSLSCLSL